MKYTILGVIIIILGGSFAAEKLLKSKVNPEEITNMQFFEPITYISYVETGNNAVPNDSMSAIRTQFILKLIHEYRGQLHITGTISLADTAIKQKVTDELELTIRSATRYGNLYCMKPTPCIDSILQSRGKRFGLCTVSVGFTRKRGNYGIENAKSRAKAFLRNGWDSEETIPLNSSLFIIIFDAKEHDVAFFGQSYKPEHPLNEDLLRKRFVEVFHGYFNLK